jgi:hypothetical protein
MDTTTLNDATGYCLYFRRSSRGLSHCDATAVNEAELNAIMALMRLGDGWICTN